MSNQVGEAGARGIRLLLESLKLERLVLSGSNLQDEGAAVVAGAINGNTFLKVSVSVISIDRAPASP